MEPYWHRTHTSPPNSPVGARWRPAPLLPPLLVQDKSWGRMACRYRPRHACATHRWPPSGGFQCSLLSKDKLSNRLLFYEFTLRSISQKRLRKILGLSCSTLRHNSVLWKVKKPEDREKQRVQKQGALWIPPQRLTVNLSSTGTDTSLLPSLWTSWLLNYVLCCHHKQVYKQRRAENTGETILQKWSNSLKQQA